MFSIISWFVFLFVCFPQVIVYFLKHILIGIYLLNTAEPKDIGYFMSIQLYLQGFNSICWNA